jgi:CTP synthase (UTP-ammonia lyase)
VRAADALGAAVDVTWVPTPSNLRAEMLAEFDGIRGSPGACTGAEGALEAIKFARERGKPFVGT